MFYHKLVVIIELFVLLFQKLQQPILNRIEIFFWNRLLTKLRLNVINVLKQNTFLGFSLHFIFCDYVNEGILNFVSGVFLILVIDHAVKLILSYERFDKTWFSQPWQRLLVIFNLCVMAFWAELFININSHNYGLVIIFRHFFVKFIMDMPKSIITAR